MGRATYGAGGLEQVQFAFQEPQMNNLIRRLIKDKSGATAVEYGLVAAGISVAIIAIINTLGGQWMAIVSSHLAAGK
jgi:pilus assembly protein Flp/PilA